MNQLFKYDPNSKRNLHRSFLLHAQANKNNNQWKLAVVALVGLLFLSKILSLFF